MDRLDYISLIFANPDEDAVSAYYDCLVVYKGTKITFNGLSNGLFVELWDEAGSLVHRKLASSSSLIFDVESESISIPFNGKVKIIDTIPVSVSNVQGDVYFKVYGFNGNLLWTINSIAVYE